MTEESEKMSASMSAESNSPLSGEAENQGDSRPEFVLPEYTFPPPPPGNEGDIIERI